MNPGRERYDRYMASQRWERRKAAYWSRHRKVCASCHSTEDIHLHHHTYARFEHEDDDDFTPLCDPCHTAVHILHRSGRLGSLADATAAAVQAGKARQGKPWPRPQPPPFQRKPPRNWRDEVRWIGPKS